VCQGESSRAGRCDWEGVSGQGGPSSGMARWPVARESLDVVACDRDDVSGARGRSAVAGHRTKVTGVCVRGRWPI
jgi:hypothetical protein